MPVNRADIGKAHLLKEQTFVGRRREMDGCMLGSFGGFVDQSAADRHSGDHALGRVFAGLIQRLHAKLGEIGRQSADVFCNGHFVVI